MSGRIVVGIDGSASAAAALAWAASEARLRGAELVACSVVERRPGHDDASDSSATLALEESAGGYPTTLVTRHGEPGVELLAACDDADLLVVGSRGRGRLAGSLLGSVSRACVRHARCPVVVVGHRSATVPGGRVVAGVDGSPPCACGAPRRRTRSPVAGRDPPGVARRPLGHHRDRVDHANAGAALGVGHKLVADELATTGVDGEPAVVAGHPDEVLVQHSGDADLLVLGTRGHNPAASLLLGSVSEHCVRYARCPVLVTRADRQHRDDQAQASSSEPPT